MRKTDQTINETSMVRQVTADEERREIVSRETTIKASDKLTVIWSAVLMAGAVQQMATGDYACAVGGIIWQALPVTKRARRTEARK